MIGERLTARFVFIPKLGQTSSNADVGIWHYLCNIVCYIYWFSFLCARTYKSKCCVLYDFTFFDVICPQYAHFKDIYATQDPFSSYRNKSVCCDKPIPIYLFVLFVCYMTYNDDKVKMQSNMLSLCSIIPLPVFVVVINRPIPGDRQAYFGKRLILLYYLIYKTE